MVDRFRLFQRMPVWIKRAGALASSVFLGSCVGMNPTQHSLRNDVEKTFRDSGSGAESVLEEGGGRTLHFVKTTGGRNDLPFVVFVHGSPGAWTANEGFLKDPDLLARANMISVDRPGFGGSGWGNPVASLAEQSQMLKTVFGDEGTGGRKAVLVGHSYGGPLAVRMALDHPGKVSGLVLVAPAIDPDLQHAYWFQRVGAWKPMKWIVGKSLFATSRELVPLHEDLVEMSPRWREVEVPTVVIQGGRDFLVRKGVADFAERKLVSAPSSVRRHPNLSHFIPWTRPDLVREAVLDLLDGKVR